MVFESSRIHQKLTSFVSVDASNHISAADPDVGEGTLPRVLSIAVTAATIHLPHIRRKEVLHSNSSTTIVLEHLILSVTGTASIDIGCAGRLFEGRSVLAHIGPPHVVQRAGTETVHTFAVVGTDDDVG
jgi:hypothetical protein